MANKIQKVGKVLNVAEDLSTEGLNRALDIIRGSKNLSKDLALAETTLPQELMPLVGISQGKARKLILPGDFTTSLNEIYSEGATGTDFMDANKTIQNLSLLAPDVLRKLKSVEQYSAPAGRGRIGILNDSRKKYSKDSDELFDPSLVDWTHVNPLAELYQEMSVRSLLNQGITPDARIPLFRKFYPKANTGEGNKPVLSFARDADTLQNPRFNMSMGEYGDGTYDVVNTPIQVYDSALQDIVGSDLILPHGRHYGERELQANKNAIRRIGSISPHTNEAYDVNNKRFGDIVDLLLENGIDLYNLPMGFGHNM